MKTAIVTGSNRGIGLEICRQLDKSGWQVILCSRDMAKGKKASNQLSKKVIVKQLDVTDEASVNQLFEFVNAEIGKLDVLINNAGLGSNTHENPIISGTKQNVKKHFHGIYQVVKKIKPLFKKTKLFNSSIGAENVSLHYVKKTMETNFYGSWQMIKVFVPLLQKSECGRIINVSSGMGALNNLTGLYPDYSLSKASLNALTIMFSNELLPKGIKVNAVCPGWVKTDMGGPDAPGKVSEGADTAVWLAVKEEIPTGKFFKDRQIIDW